MGIHLPSGTPLNATFWSQWRIARIAELFSEGNPFLVRRGGRDIKKMLRSHLVMERTGWSLARALACEATTPSALLRRLRDIFFLAQPPPPHEEGNFARPWFFNS